MQQIIVEDGRAVGIRLESGEEVYAKIILSNATPKVTFLDLLPKVSIIMFVTVPNLVLQ